jgi:hypothetical protein
MDIGSILLVVGLFILVSLFIAQPVFTRRATGVRDEEILLSSLRAERERLLNALHELDFDFVLHKVPEEEYPVQRDALMAQTVEVLHKLDEAGSMPPEMDPDKRIEADLAKRRQDTQPLRNGKRSLPAGAIQDDDLEARIASRRRERSEKAAGFCPQCGKAVQVSDRFCPKCGAQL